MPVERKRCVFVAAALAALITGATGSLHCALMCGPLACAGGTSRAGVIGWQLGRISSYVLVGAALGAIGRGVSVLLVSEAQRVMPWVMAAGLILTAFDLTRRVPPIPGLKRVTSFFAARATSQQSPGARGFLFGVLTPLLPCGLLYGLFLAAIATGDALEGAGLLGAFGLGALPALLAVQLGASRLSLSPRVSFVVRRLVPVAAAAVLIVRALLVRPEVTQCGS